MISRRKQLIGIAIGLASLAIGGLAVRFIPRLIEQQRVVSQYTKLLSASFDGDLRRVEDLCSTRYLAGHPLRKAAEGGVVGMPRGIHKNFQIWRDGSSVLFCPTNRVGPVYGYIYERGDWRFDGPIGLLRSGGQLLRIPESDLLDETEDEALPREPR